MTSIQDVAKMAEVSVATVSHVVNHTRYVSPKTAQKVEEVIDSLDELPNFIVKKRGMGPSDKQQILVFATNIFHPFQAGIIKELQEITAKKNELRIVNVQTDDLIQTLKSYSIANTKSTIGKVLLLDRPIEESLKVHSSMKTVPTVVVSENEIKLTGSQAKEAYTIISDSYQGAYDSVNHLINHGHERIVLIDDCYKQCGTESDLYKGYRQAFVDRNITLTNAYVIESSATEKIHETLSKEQSPTALIIASEDALLQVLTFLNSRNKKCPEDISIICFNDRRWFELFTPALTAVRQDVSRISETILSYLQKELSEGSQLKEQAYVSTKIRLRQSTSGIARGPFGEKAASVDSIQINEEEITEVRNRKPTAVISFHYTGAAWMHLHERGIRDLFSKWGISLLAVTDAHFDPDMQNKQLEGLMALDPDIVIAIPTEDNKTSEVFQKIAASQSKLILITNVPNGLSPEDYVSCVSVNEWSHGRLAGSGLGSMMRDEEMKQIGLLLYDSDFYATNQRDAAARQILMEEYSDLEIVGEGHFKEEIEVVEKTKELLLKHPEIEGLYISWEGPACKVLQTLKEIGREDILVGTADLDYELALYMAKGKNVKKISAQLPYDQGKALALVAANAVLGKHVPKFIGVEPVEVTQENLLKMWNRIFKESAPKEVVEAVKAKPTYLST
ncbi:ribose transport system substrate-binding protein [Sinobaca qinghaiensis]|uniref:Ribose transport system substrate-binding protein n=1 Tax=Sinobaca qinghaiensis TaxID=342944 RepID=A0A419V7M5_9BACL|nr:LacI family DNA-binding transcriptional regulator [Sinobaca qinghaiensis]RKD75978.1 ribose transport system substrate-binding protein [Sinobaca qinghaiensis]